MSKKELHTAKPTAQTIRANKVITIYRTYLHDRTESHFEVAGEEFRMLELPDLNNMPFHSCIPEGQYIVEPDNTGRHKYFRVQDVKGRTDIEWHPATTVDQLEGCEAPCYDIIDGKAIGSTRACDRLKELFGNSSFVINIVEDSNE